MKFLFPFLIILSMVLFACSLDEESAIPVGKTNIKEPVFLSTEIRGITHDSIQAKAYLSFIGNLTILHHGWVWSENPKPTLEDGHTIYGALALDSFDLPVSGLTLGKTYHLRPFVITGADTIYDPEGKSILMGIPKLNDLALLADSACFLRLNGTLQSPLALSEYGVVYLRGTGMPTLQKNNGKILGTGIENDNFDLDLTMLIPNTTYSIRSYAVTSSGTGYSRVLSITTPVSTLQSPNFIINTDAEIFREAIVQFTNTSVGPAAFFWSFGDGEATTEISPAHTFNNLGSMAVQLIAEHGGCTLTKDTLLQVVTNPFESGWIEVEGDTFTMGCTMEQQPDCNVDEYPTHQVTISTFIIGKTEVTQRQWQAVTGSNPSFFYKCGLDCPVETITWNRIIDEFIPALNRKTGREYRLPTEAEWEFAARGGKLSKGYKYAGSNNVNSVAWHISNSSGKIHPVGTKMANELGLYDMSGNVWEWCSDWYSEIYYKFSPSTNPTGPINGEYRVLRGGGAMSGFPTDYRVTDRWSIFPSASDYNWGFRLVRK